MCLEIDQIKLPEKTSLRRALHVTLNGIRSVFYVSLTQIVPGGMTGNMGNRSDSNAEIVYCTNAETLSCYYT